MKIFFTSSMAAMVILAGCANGSSPASSIKEPTKFSLSPIVSSAASSSVDIDRPQWVKVDDEGWVVTENAEIGISLKYPPEYQAGEVEHEVILFEDEKINVHTLSLRQGMGELPFIQVMRSHDPMILQYFAMNHALETVTVGANTYALFRWDGMGDAVGYILSNQEPFIIVSFIFPPTQDVIDQVIESISLL